MSAPVRASFIPFDLANKLYSKQTPWKPSPELAKNIQSIPPNDPAKYRTYKVEKGPEYDFIVNYFHANKPHGYGIKGMEFIDNPTLKRSFESNLVTMNEQAKHPIFQPRWEKDLQQTQQRRQVVADWKSSVEPFFPVTTTDGELIEDAYVLPLLHGSSVAKTTSILRTGFTKFGKHYFFNPEMGLTSLSTDQGYYGSGVYGTDSFEYAKMYSGDGIVIVSWVGHRPPLPVVSDVKHPKKCSDMALLEGREHYLNHNMHIIPVAKVKGMIYYPCFEDQMAECKEYVFFDSAQALPWMIISLSPDGPSKSLGTLYSIDEFHLACKLGEFDQIRTWIKENQTRIRDTNGAGETSLFPAVIGNQIAVLDWLSKQLPALLEISREDGSSILHLAMASGYVDIAKWIKNYSPGLMHRKNDQGDTPLYLAAFYEQKEILEVFIEEVKSDPQIVLKLSQTPNTEILTFLAEKGVAIQVMNAQKQTTLHLAAQSGQLQNVEYLLDQGLDINAVDQNGRTPLFLAVTQGQERIVHFLLTRGANTKNIAAGGETLLHVAAFYGYLSILESLFSSVRTGSTSPMMMVKLPFIKRYGEIQSHRSWNGY